MSNYSVQGYLALAKMRESKTLLVEGTTDAKVIARVLRELEFLGRLPSDGVRVDTVAVIEDSEGTLPKGSREIVEYMVNVAHPERLPLAGLVDREFRGFDLVSLTDDVGGHHTEGTLHWTRGHSVENYFFSAKHIVEYLKMKHAEHAQKEMVDFIEVYLSDILSAGAAASLALKDAELLGRSGGIGRKELWRVVEEASRVELNIEQLAGILSSRGATSDRLNTLTASFSKHLKMLRSQDTLVRWISHGHVGWDLLWGGIAALLAHRGCAADVADQIGQGALDDKIRVLSDSWVKRSLDDPEESPVGLWVWLCDAA